MSKQFNHSESNSSTIKPLFVRPRQIKSVTGMSNTTVWRLEAAGKFPKRRQIAPGCVGWLYAEVEQYLVGCDQVA